MDNRRQYPRFPFYEPVGYQKYRDLPLEGSIAGDISQTGLKLNVSEFIPLHSTLELQIQMPGQTQVIPTRAKVVWVREIPHQDNSWQVGLELVPDESASFAIRDYIGLRRLESA